MHSTVAELDIRIPRTGRHTLVYPIQTFVTSKTPPLCWPHKTQPSLVCAQQTVSRTDKQQKTGTDNPVQNVIRALWSHWLQPVSVECTAHSAHTRPALDCRFWLQLCTAVHQRTCTKQMKSMHPMALPILRNSLCWQSPNSLPSPAFYASPDSLQLLYMAATLQYQRTAAMQRDTNASPTAYVGCS